MFGFRSQADGVAEFFNILYKYWDKPLQELHQKSMAKKAAAGSEVVLIEIEDDDGDCVTMDKMEAQSLQDALQGIDVDGYELPDEINAPENAKGDASLTDEPLKEKKDEAVEKENQVKGGPQKEETKETEAKTTEELRRERIAKIQQLVYS